MKHINKNMKIFVAVLAVIFISTYSWAGAKNDIIRLSPTKAHPNASGTAVIDNEHLSIQTRGLNPNAVYTVWFVNTKPKKHETGAGTPPYMFKTDGWGNGSYSAPVSKSPFGEWAMVMVVLHPTGDPKDMKNMVGALSAKL